jgi:hypothetical protein
VYLLNRRTGDQEIQTLEHKLFAVDFASSAHRSADAPVERASGSSASTGMDKNFVISAANNLQALLCLSNLTSAGADDPTKVRVYANFIEQRVQALGKLVCPMLWNSA